MQVLASQDLSQVRRACVRQAFLPKFENEGKDSETAASIINQVKRVCLYIKLLIMDGVGWPAVSNAAFACHEGRHPHAST
jgi:hypothetical protein